MDAQQSPDSDRGDSWWQLGPPTAPAEQVWHRPRQTDTHEEELYEVLSSERGHRMSSLNRCFTVTPFLLPFIKASLIHFLCFHLIFVSFSPSPQLSSQLFPSSREGEISRLGVGGGTTQTKKQQGVRQRS